MKNETYNGWTNYATWRVNLEVFDGMDLRQYFDDQPQLPPLNEVAKWAKDFVQSMIDDSVHDGCHIVEGWARAFAQDVDWYEIAEHLIENASEVDA